MGLCDLGIKRKVDADFLNEVDGLFSKDVGQIIVYLHFIKITVDGVGPFERCSLRYRRIDRCEGGAGCI